MKTKEIEVWVFNNVADGYMNGSQDSIGCFRDADDDMIKAKLIIEIPEKKIQITESMLRDCFDSFQRLESDQERKLVYSFLEYTKKRLFNAP